ncbi:L-rhamnose/proton symporter RhaT [Terriglobus saanensis]|uniref:RhaT l-rhamnose-proton symport 2 n=1 Tax=Terriglobus saanensis (strain ATCC BAA-1853 / DSM 23119 / SP1PR4) TaxID=401053 RepID=E8V0Z2_TERSS|nr:rhamnose/proton symporter RhaT [Terriglobus saanensis]ADV82283.1 RhaT l-rhamnose-proton symport 2 [Terriglobus saanensis SP1PR4]
MGANPLIGVIYHWIGGFASATNFIPFRGIKRWSWEVYWLIQGFAAWIVAPLVLCSIFVPHTATILMEAPRHTIYLAMFWGILWGVGGITFGLSIRYLGLALGYAIALGFCTFFGTLMPPIFAGTFGTVLHDRSGQIVLGGLALCLVAIAVNGTAGYLKEHEVTEEEKADAGERDFSFARGLAVAIFAGFMSAFFSVGLSAGKPIGDIARAHLVADGRLDLWQNLPVLIVVLWGGFITNLIWSGILIYKNKSAAEFVGQPGRNPLRAAAVSGNTIAGFDPTDPSLLRLSTKTLIANYFLAALAGVIWYFQFFFYSMGQTKMGHFEFSSWTLHMASIILFATLWGVLLKEWRGTRSRTKMLVTLGVCLLIGSTIVVGYGNYVKTNETAPATISAHK